MHSPLHLDSDSVSVCRHLDSAVAENSYSIYWVGAVAPSITNSTVTELIPQSLSERLSDGEREIWSDAVSFTITHPESDATIHYTTDGNEPTTSSAVFNPASPIAYASGTAGVFTIKAVAIRPRSLVSLVSSYTVSEFPPEPSHSVFTHYSLLTV